MYGYYSHKFLNQRVVHKCLSHYEQYPMSLFHSGSMRFVYVRKNLVGYSLSAMFHIYFLFRKQNNNHQFVSIWMINASDSLCKNNNCSAYIHLRKPDYTKRPFSDTRSNAIYSDLSASCALSFCAQLQFFLFPFFI